MPKSLENLDLKKQLKHLSNELKLFFLVLINIKLFRKNRMFRLCAFEFQVSKFRTADQRAAYIRLRKNLHWLTVRGSSLNKKATKWQPRIQFKNHLIFANNVERGTPVVFTMSFTLILFVSRSLYSLKARFKVFSSLPWSSHMFPLPLSSLPTFCSSFYDKITFKFCEWT